jgi:Outer membrane protein beta-barrel domain
MSLKKLMPNIVIIALMFHVSSTQGHAQAKTETPKIELGLQITMVNLGGVKPVLPGSTNPGFGGRITWNLNHRYSVESEVNFFPRDLFERGRRTQALFGMKMSARVENAGIFLKIRPGFIHFDQAAAIATLVDRGSFNAMNFALDLGAGVEFYPSRHTILRFDFGDTVIRLSGINCPFPGCSRTNYSHNFQFNAGIGLRF